MVGLLARGEHSRRPRDGAGCSRALDALPMPLIGRIHGAALGGGAGLAAVCDIVVAAEDAIFGFTEVKLGILPAVISPYVLAKIGQSAARELFLTGARFSAAARRAKSASCTRVGDADELDRSGRQVRRRRADGSAPDAVAAAKR